MGSLDSNSIHEFNEKSPFSPEIDSQKLHPMHTAKSELCSGGLQAGRSLMSKTPVYKSLKTVVFSSKLNLLIPFGPLAIIVEKLTGHRVSCSSCCLE